MKNKLLLFIYGLSAAFMPSMGMAQDGFNVPGELSAGVFYSPDNFGNTGVVTAMALTQALYGKMDLTMCLNGALAGLVAITAGPDLQNHLVAIVVGAIGAALAVFAVPLLDKLKIDDVVGAIPVHLVAGIWGTLAVGIFGSGNFVSQLIGVISVGVFVFLVSGAVWFIIKTTVGIRVDAEEEEAGLDAAELGLEAYPEFGSA